MAIEELNDAREDIEEIVESVDCLQLIRVRKMQLPLDIKSMMAPRIKGWLFTYYSLTEEIESGDHMNDRTLMHQNWIARQSTPSEVDERERLFMKNGAVERGT